MRPADIDEVRQLELFRDCQEGTFGNLLRAAYLQRFPRGVVLIQDGERADFLYVLIEGLVELYGRHDGVETTISFAAPMDTFILAAVLKDEVYLQSARTLEPSRVLLIPAEAVREAMREDCAFMSAIVAELSTCYRGLVKELKNQKLRTGLERIANWVLQAEAQQGERGVVEIGVEKRVLASRLGMTPENLSRGFASLHPHGLVVEGAVLRLYDKQRLIAFARPDPLIDDPAA